MPCKSSLRRLLSMNKDGKLATKVAENPRIAAEVADLRYVDTDEPGWRRKRWGRGFTYVDLAGEHIGPGPQRDRIEALAIPPAWTDVWICPEQNGHIQATGRDDKGRKQYIYHPRWQEIRNQTKFSRMVRFGQALPHIRARIDRDLRKHGAKRERVLAAVVRLLQNSLIRVGNAEYARDNGSFGLTTMRDEHLDLNGDRLQFEFKGKSGKTQRADVRDPRVARVVRQLQELPGQDLFQYEDEDGNLRHIESQDVNEYINAAVEGGETFSAKDFRTWGGTVQAVRVLREMGPAADTKDADANVVELYRKVAEHLGNTAAVCRQYYVHPLAPEAYRQGIFFDVCENLEGEPDDEWLEPEERVALALLQLDLEIVDP